MCFPPENLFPSFFKHGLIATYSNSYFQTLFWKIIHFRGIQVERLLWVAAKKHYTELKVNHLLLKLRSEKNRLNDSFYPKENEDMAFVSKFLSQTLFSKGALGNAQSPLL